MFNVFNLVKGLDDRDTIALVEALAITLPSTNPAKKLMFCVMDELMRVRQARVVMSIEITGEECELAVNHREIDAVKALRARRPDLSVHDCMERINAAIELHKAFGGDSNTGDDTEESPPSFKTYIKTMKFADPTAE
jgi:hypothetical protein